MRRIHDQCVAVFGLKLAVCASFLEGAHNLMADVGSGNGHGGKGSLLCFLSHCCVMASEEILVTIGAAVGTLATQVESTRTEDLGLTRNFLTMASDEMLMAMTGRRAFVSIPRYAGRPKKGDPLALELLVYLELIEVPDASTRRMFLATNGKQGGQVANVGPSGVPRHAWGAKLEAT